MLAIALGVAVAVTYGAGDFFGGLSARKVADSVTVLVSQASALLVLLIVVPFAGGSPTLRGCGLGALGGLAGVAGVTLLYRGLAAGDMGVFAPITAVGAAVVPLAFGLATGDKLSGWTSLGAVVALAGVAGVATGGGDPAAPRDLAAVRAQVGWASLTGAIFGLVFVLLGRTGDDAGLWPILFQRLASVSAALLVVRRRRLAVAPARAELRTIVPAGLCDGGANALFLLAARAGNVSVASVLGSLYPASTVVLARFVLHERLRRTQVAGLVLVGAGVGLIAAR